ncbi:SDR family NAD(P)-dependent oxidoreductase, partial [bacterium]|nr:SDR family NAD(P)-dependent oxidoreductase [bacterium]
EPLDEELNQFVLSTVSEKTGYPIEMLDLDLDLEADLGIDTVKQAELFATIRTHFGIAKREDLRLSDYNTLAKVIGFIKDGKMAQIVTTETLLEFEKVTPAVNDTDEKPLTQREPKPVLLPRIDLCEPTGISLESGRVIILKGQDKLTTDTAKQLAKLLDAKKAEVLILDAGKSLDEAESWLKAGTVSGVYCLTGLDSDPAWNENREASWKEAVSQRIEPLFELVKLIPSDAFLISATRMGGLHGIMNPMNPMGGTISGFTKAYSRERSSALVKVVDYQSCAKPNFIAESLLQETLSDLASLEIGRENELRFTLILSDIEMHNQNLHQFTGKEVFVISGGTGGITAAVIDDLARRSKGRFILLSRTAIADLSDADRNALQSDPVGLKNRLMKELASTGVKVTPVQLEGRFSTLERAAATLDLIQRIEGYGAQATYIQCDVTDLASVTQAVAEVEKSVDHVDYFIHAAGLEKSRKLESKTLEEFHQVVDVKVGGFMNLFTALEKSKRIPKSVVLFSSIAGRFGNAGQPDYSAGNDFLSKMAAWLPTQYANLQVISLDWGAWAEIGMASRGSIPLVME